jgi:tyrosine-protein kinase Etk/Wzc
MRAISATWRERFDVVIVDTPPIAGLADGLILCSLADAMVLVARAGVTKPAELTAATTSLYQTHTALSGLVVFEETASELYYPYGGEREGGSRRRDPAKAR